jgi:hypothetical protein
VPTTYESFGLVLCEGLWAGVPVLSGRVGVCLNQAGLTREIPNPATPEAIVGALEADLADPGATAARVAYARAWARERLTPERFGREWTDLIAQVAGWRPRCAYREACGCQLPRCEHPEQGKRLGAPERLLMGDGSVGTVYRVSAAACRACGGSERKAH